MKRGIYKTVDVSTSPYSIRDPLYEHTIRHYIYEFKIDGITCYATTQISVQQRSSYDNGVTWNLDFYNEMHDSCSIYINESLEVALPSRGDTTWEEPLTEMEPSEE